MVRTFYSFLSEVSYFNGWNNMYDWPEVWKDGMTTESRGSSSNTKTTAEKKLNFNYLSEKVYPLFQNLYKLREQNGDPSVVQTFFSHRVGEISRYFFVCGSGEKHPLAPKKQFTAVSLARCHNGHGQGCLTSIVLQQENTPPHLRTHKYVTQGGMVTLMHRCNSGLISGWLAVASI